MKITNLQKCSLYLQVNDLTGSIDYDVWPQAMAVSANENLIRYDFLIDINSPFIIKILITNRSSSTSHLLVDRIEIAGIKINNLDKISFMKTQTGEIKRTNGYLDAVGEFRIKLHTNPISQNNLNYILSLTNTN